MQNKVLFAVALSGVLVLGSSAVRAENPREQRHQEQGHQEQGHEEQRHEEHHEEHHEDHHEGHAAGWRQPPPPRAAPPRFQGHPPGAHPQGSPYRPHPVRVLRPTVIRRGGERGWRHWGHPEFVRPVYYWNWTGIQRVTCVAEDSYGDQYPVTEETWSGFGLPDMTNVEDDALDRCYAESGGDQTCYLATCSHY